MNSAPYTLVPLALCVALLGTDTRYSSSFVRREFWISAEKLMIHSSSDTH